MLDKLEAIYARWEDVELKLSSPEIINDMKRFKLLNKEYKDLKPLVDAYHTYKNIVQNLEFSKEVLYNEKDIEMKEMAKEEVEALNIEKEKLEDEIK